MGEWVGRSDRAESENADRDRFALITDGGVSEGEEREVREAANFYLGANGFVVRVQAKIVDRGSLFEVGCELKGFIVEHHFLSDAMLPLWSAFCWAKQMLGHNRNRKRC